MNSRSFTRRVSTVVLVVGALVAGASTPVPSTAAVPAVRDASAKVVTADALPTAQIDGVVWTQKVVGDTVFAGGEFKTARPAGAAPGVDTVPRANLLAYNIKTGVLTSFAPKMNGVVRTLATSRDGKTLYVGGSFSKVNGKARSHFAAFKVKSGKLTSLAPTFNSRVNAITVATKTIYVGGWFTAANRKARGRLAAFTLGGKLRSWHPKADDSVNALVMTPDRSRVIVGGSVSHISGKAVRGMGAVDAKSGRVKTWKINKIIKDHGYRSGIFALSADKDTVYGAGYGQRTGNFEGVFAARPKDGKVVWLQDCHGDQYDVVAVGSTVYTVGHAHYCANIGGFPESTPQRTLAVTKKAAGTVAKNGQVGKPNYTNFEGRPAPALLQWFPQLTPGTYTGLTQAAWSIAAGSGYVVLGGEFSAVNGVPQQGLVRFAVPSKAPNAEGPAATNKLTPVARRTADGVQLRWTANWDRDDESLAYAVYRDGAPLATITSSSQYWKRPALTYLDAAADAGPHRYRIKVSDKDGNSVWMPTVSVE